MSERYGEDVVFVLTKDDILACASDLGISRELVTGDVIELVKKRLGLELHNWTEVVKRSLKQAIKCPLGLDCYPSCFWCQDGKCTFSGEG